MNKIKFTVLITIISINFILLNGSIKSFCQSSSKINTTQKDSIKKRVDELVIKYKGQYPDEKEDVWTEECQGISNNDTDWFITQAKALWKVPFNKNLSKSFKTGDGTFKVGIPKTLKDLGYNHFGDQDNWNGYIFIPVQGSNKLPVIAVFAEDDLSFIDYAEIKGQESGAWCAINPISTHLTTSHTYISKDKPIEVYAIDWWKLDNFATLKLTEQEGYYLENLPEGWNNQVANPLQGGDWSTDGCYLYLSNGYAKGGTKNKGLSVYKNIDNTYGKFQMASSQGGDEFRFQWSPDCCKYEEPEGLSYNEYYNTFSDKIGLTHLHAILLDNDGGFGGRDDVYIKHYNIKHPSCGGCNDPCSANYKPNVLYNDGSCQQYDTICNDDDCNTADSYDSENCKCVNKTITAPICDSDPCVNGGVYFYDSSVCECLLNESTNYGCTDNLACNYNPLANCEDGTCDYGMPNCSDPCCPAWGCTHNIAVNFSPKACIDDGSCKYPNAPIIYPNPAESIITITIDDDMLGTEIFVTNIKGKAMPVILNGSTSENNFSLDISLFEYGIYYFIAIKGDFSISRSFSKI